MSGLLCKTWSWSLSLARLGLSFGSNLDGTMLLKFQRILKVYIYILSSPRVSSSLFTLCQPLREVASVVGTSIKRLWLQNAKQQDAACDPISVLNALQGKKLRSLSTMAGKSGKCSQGANKLERGLY